MCWGIMVWHTKDLLWTEALQSALAQSVESLRRCDLMTVQSVDIELCGTILYNLYDVLVPNLVK